MGASQDQPPGALAAATLWGVWWMLAGIVVAAAAIAIISVGLGFSLLVGAAALVLIGLGLRRANDLLRPICEDHPWWCLLAGLAGVAIGGALLAWAFAEDSPAIGAVAVGIVVLGVLPLSNALFHFGRLEPAWTVGTGVALAVATVVTHGWLEAHALWAVSLGAAGFVAYRIGIRPLCAPEPADPPRSQRCVAAGAVAVVAGAASVGAVAAGWLADWILVAAAFAILYGFLALSVAWPAAGLWPLGRAGAALVGLVALVVAGVLLVTSGLPLLFYLGAAVAVAGLGVSLVWRGEGFVVLALAGLAVIWVLVPRVDPAPLDPRKGATDRILGLGDSYSSGEGAPEFFKDTSKKGSNDCRRTSTAYAYLVATKMEMGLDFFACSGAKAIEIWDEGQERSSPDEIPGKLPQLDNLTDYSNTRAVILTIGGNDALFGDIGSGCAFPGSCTEFQQLWLANLTQQGQAIETALVKIKEKVGEGTPVVVLPYPMLVTEARCSWSPLEGDEHAFLFEFITALNEQVATSAARAGVNFFNPGLFVYDDARLCDGNSHDDAAVNIINLQPVDGSIFDRLNPANWIHGSVHPKPDGHRRVADALKPYLEDLLAAAKADPAAANPPANEQVTFRLPALLARTGPVDLGKLLPTDRTTIACPVDELSPFATRMRRLGSVVIRGAQVQEAPFPLDAAPGSVVCHTARDGTWTDSTAPGSVVTTEGAQVFARPEEPTAGDNQLFVYQRAGDGRWRLLVVDFCSRDPDCPTDVASWRTDQLVTAAQRLSPMAILLFVGGWLLALGIRSPEPT